MWWQKIFNFYLKHLLFNDCYFSWHCFSQKDLQSFSSDNKTTRSKHTHSKIASRVSEEIHRTREKRGNGVKSRHTAREASVFRGQARLVCSEVKRVRVRARFVRARFSSAAFDCVRDVFSSRLLSIVCYWALIHILASITDFHLASHSVSFPRS